MSKRQVLELKGGEELVITLYGDEQITVSREKGNRKQLVIVMPEWCSAWKGKDRAKKNGKPISGFRVTSG